MTTMISQSIRYAPIVFRSKNNNGVKPLNTFEFGETIIHCHLRDSVAGVWVDAEGLTMGLAMALKDTEGVVYPIGTGHSAQQNYAETLAEWAEKYQLDRVWVNTLPGLGEKASGYSNHPIVSMIRELDLSIRPLISDYALPIQALSRLESLRLKKEIDTGHMSGWVRVQEAIAQKQLGVVEQAMLMVLFEVSDNTVQFAVSRAIW